MIRVDFDPDRLTGSQRSWWDEWQTRAVAATKDVINAWETWLQSSPHNKDKRRFSYDFDSDLWKELRDWLLVNVFHGNCAYCQTHVVREKFHADHFRPKGQVKCLAANSEPSIVKVPNEWDSDEQRRGEVVDHPGYFWLAYHWKNLLPACPFCNAFEGKKDLFPIKGTYVAIKRLSSVESVNLIQAMIQSGTWDDLYYLQPDDLDILEDRMLLHPFDAIDPRDHLVCDEFGVFAPRAASARGAASILVYDLVGDELRAARAEAMQLAAIEYFTRICQRGSIELKCKASEEFLAPFRRGERPYSFAVLEYLHQLLSGGPFDPFQPTKDSDDPPMAMN